MTKDSVKGYIFAAVAAAAYGTNPAFAVPLYEQGMNPNSVLLFRYLLGLPVLALVMWQRGTGFKLPLGTIFPVAVLGILMALSSLTLFESYNYMNSGVASTLLFVYPVMVAVLMIFFFREKFRISLGLCLVLMCAGLLLLLKPQGADTLSAYGVVLVMVSALTYALYIIMVNVNRHIRDIPTTKLLFYVLAWGCLVFIGLAATRSPLTVPAYESGWLSLGALALIPTLVSLGCTTRAIQLIGSTPTAILGALEPVSAAVLSVVVLGQTLTTTDIVGGAFIVLATIVVIAGNPVDKAILHVRKMFPRRRR